jgi:isochorismate pyruvate lyase
MKLWTAIIEWSIQYEERLMGDKAPRGAAAQESE